MAITNIVTEASIHGYMGTKERHRPASGDRMILSWPFFINSVPEAAKAAQNSDAYIHSRIR
ncbi:hypothetical protein N6P31_15600 [Pectobacterium betavasculorum]|uniref:hypothetical protein n=1 Tax=Pectobacterium betavasculorum TaxID=55207 RepID=UPI0012E0258C|nr:hypothetical protein [Pectobacterium betavasculorum]